MSDGTHQEVTTHERRPHPVTDRAGGERPATERAETMLNRLGERVGSSAAGATARLRHAGAPHRPNESAMARSEALVSRLEDAIGPYATVVGRRLQRLAARAREEVEDIWAEAQHVRAQRHRAPGGGDGEAG